MPDTKSDRALSILVMTGQPMTASQIYAADAVDGAPAFLTLCDAARAANRLARITEPPVEKITVSRSRYKFLARPDAIQRYEAHKRRVAKHRALAQRQESDVTAKRTVFLSREDELKQRAERIAGMRARHKAQAGGALGVRGLWL